MAGLEAHVYATQAEVAQQPILGHGLSGARESVHERAHAPPRGIQLLEQRLEDRKQARHGNRQGIRGAQEDAPRTERGRRAEIAQDTAHVLAKLLRRLDPVPLSVKLAEGACVEGAALCGLHDKRQVLVRREDAHVPEHEAEAAGIGACGDGIEPRGQRQQRPRLLRDDRVDRARPSPRAAVHALERGPREPGGVVDDGVGGIAGEEQPHTVLTRAALLDHLPAEPPAPRHAIVVQSVKAPAAIPCDDMGAVHADRDRMRLQADDVGRGAALGVEDHARDSGLGIRDSTETGLPHPTECDCHRRCTAEYIPSGDPRHRRPVVRD